MSLQSKKSFAMVNYEKCDPNQCDSEEGICMSVQACPQKIIKQLDGAFEPPMIFHDLCLGCWECMEALKGDPNKRGQLEVVFDRIFI